MEAQLQQYLKGIYEGEHKSLARSISLVENAHPLGESLLLHINPKQSIPVIGVTGPPGAGKSTLVCALVEALAEKEKRVAVLAVDPSSPFNMGSLLGDRIRMSSLYRHPNVFIRSMASRGTLGGLTEKTIEITDLMKSANFDYVIVETVGVGQSELDIVGLANCTLLVLVPESGDEIQQVKSGIMEIADIFVVNKSDRPEADKFAQALKRNLSIRHQTQPVIMTEAQSGLGINAILAHLEKPFEGNRLNQVELMTQKAWKLIQEQRMRGLQRDVLRQDIAENMQRAEFNLYRFVRDYK